MGKVSVKWFMLKKMVCKSVVKDFVNKVPFLHIYKVRASRTVYTDRKLLQKFTSCSNSYTSAKPQMAFRGDTNYINHA